MEHMLEEARKIINEADSKMAELFEMRLKAVEMVYEYKKNFGLPILDQTREAAVIEKNTEFMFDFKPDSYFALRLRSRQPRALSIRARKNREG